MLAVGARVTTEQAADLLNVSHPYLVRLLEEGKIPCEGTGTDRQLKIEDVLAYKRARDRERDEGLGELARLTEEFGGYDVHRGRK